jgi:signal transduction histidine kinase
MRPANGIIQGIHSAQIASVFRQMPIALAVNVVNAGITALVVQRLGPAMLPLAWFWVVLLVTAGRWILWRQYRRQHTEGMEDSPHWSLLAVCGSLLAGLSWGLGGVVMFPIVPVLGQVFLTLVIGGMCAGAVVVNAPHLPSLVAFLLPASLPIAVLFFVDGSTTGNALGSMIVVFAVALSLAGSQLNRFLVETIRLRCELQEANLRLKAEMVERQATEEVLRQAQKLEAVGQLTGGIAHDFNNLLTVVIGNLVLAIGRADDNSANARLLQSALQAAERGVALVQRLLAFARKQRLDPRSVDIGSLVGSIEDLLRRTLGSSIQFSIATDPDLAPARADANQLELAILNLTINARDAMPGGGTLRIRLENRRPPDGSPGELPCGAFVVVSISDTGTGMDEATLARAFDPFFTTKEVGSGSGLGLPMVQGFAAQSGGAVQIRSKLGGGTTVELWLPATDEEPFQSGADHAGLSLPEGKGN